MKRSLYNRLLIAEEVINKNNLKLLINLDIINDFEKVNIHKSKKYSKIENSIKLDNFDNKIINKYNSKMKDILNKNYNLYNFLDESFYGNKLNCKFVSSRIIRNIINKLNVKTIYDSKNRKIIIFSSEILDDKLIEKIDSIFNFFDIITKKNNYYHLEIFLSNKKKYLNENYDVILPDNINSGATIAGNFIYIFRNEELIKVLFHELVHYLKLDMFDFQDEFRSLYNKINLDAEMINPNEAYTETLGLLLLNIWEYNYLNLDIDINYYINKKLTIELGWSYFQICKILKYFRCYNSYEDLFTNKCIFKQKTNVLSYFFLKTYFLQNINLILKDFKINNLYINYSKIKSIINYTNLQDKIFSNNINTILKSYDNTNKSKEYYSLRMSCIG